ncbi:DUF6328 family protein [Arthrobacter sp. MDB2-24]
MSTPAGAARDGTAGTAASGLEDCDPPAATPRGADPRGTAADDDGRGESRNQRLDRNWQEMLQELRVMQTGIQILTGFLLTLPFQSRFAELDDVQVITYLCLVCLSALITAMVLSAVNLHRVLFGLRVKDALVHHTGRIIQVTTGLVGLVLAGTAGLIFDIVVNRPAGLVVTGVLLVAVVLLWVAYPLAVRRRAVRRRT